jgi:hypothetical protein
MTESFADILAVGGSTNSLGRAGEVTAIVLEDKDRLEELYQCLFDDDAWVRMRAIDSIEKICRVHPEWLEPYTDRLNEEVAGSTQPSIQWHLAEMYGELALTDSQKQFAIDWLTQRLATIDVDWIVAANSMKTLVQFANDGLVRRASVITLLKIQQRHKSSTVIRRAKALLKAL